MISFLRRHWTIRVRLTLIYGGLFFVAGVVLLGVTYALLAEGFHGQPLNSTIVFGFDDGPAPSESMLRESASKVPLSPARGDVAALAADLERAGLEPSVAADMAERAKLGFDLQADVQQGALDSMISGGILALGAVEAGALGVGWIVAGRTLRPIKQITATARKVAGSNLKERIALVGPRDELRELADTFDSMLERLDRSFDGQRRFVANASHELRTPLTINRTLLEVALGRPDASADLRQLGGTLLEINARHERLIEGLLILARSDREVTERQPIDLAQVAAHVIDQTSDEAAAANVKIVTALQPAITAGDPVLLERLALNLVQNAVRHNTTDGWVNVSVQNGNATTILTVTNTGPVIRAYEIPRLFEPFRRLAGRVNSARGTGLGLSIVRSVAHAHGGKVVAKPRPAGGLIVEVTLPASAPLPARR